MRDKLTAAFGYYTGRLKSTNNYVKDKPMTIRNAACHDAPAIKLLAEASGCTARLSGPAEQLETIFGHDDHQVLI
jgi:hypothetical protein